MTTDNTTKRLSASNIYPGDILLGYSENTAEEITAQPLGYSHAAIALSNQQVFEASNTGVRICALHELLDDYDHLAVLTSNHVWEPSKLDRLENFARLQSNKSFNMVGMQRVPERRQNHSNEVMERVRNYFDGKYQPQLAERRSYFCSQLIVSAFIDAGIITASGSIVDSPDIQSPSDLAINKLYGFFRCYIHRSEKYKVPETDHFLTWR